MKNGLLLVFLISIFCQLKAQKDNCVFKQPSVTIDFGTGEISDLNTAALDDYSRVQRFCPTDGHYAYADYTTDCFRGDWQTLEDHTPGDGSGNMLLVNSSYRPGIFFQTTITGLKSNTIYEFGVWMMNVCRITEKCPYPLLPNITIILQTPSGKNLTQFATGEVPRVEAPHWTQYRAEFTTPVSETSLTLTMINNKPGGCGNDFALDDISFRECVPKAPVASVTPKKTPVAKKQTISNKPVTKKPVAVSQKNQPQKVPTEKPNKDLPITATPVLKKQVKELPPPPLVLRTRTNSLVKQIETQQGEIRVDLYDNGEIDGDTVSIYHNNALVVSHAKLSQKPITLRIAINDTNPYHELVMVAENLGSIPPNTSLMIITAGAKRYQAFITSTEQKNSKVILNLKE